MTQAPFRLRRSGKHCIFIRSAQAPVLTCPNCYEDYIMIKKKHLISGIMILLMISITFWWHAPVSFLKSVNAEDITAISVRDGQTGKCFDIANKEDIRHIVESVQKPSFHKAGLSLLYMGTFLTLSFYKEDGRMAGRFIVNTDKNIRKDPFFYKTDTGNMQITEYISALEQVLAE